MKRQNGLAVVIFWALIVSFVIQVGINWALLKNTQDLQNRVFLLEQQLEDEPVQKVDAIEVFIQTTNPSIPVGQAARIAAVIKESAMENGLDPQLLAAVAKRESRFVITAKGPTNDHGLFQLQPATFHSVHSGCITDLHDNTEAAARYLSRLIRRFGDIRLALAAYNCGPSRRPNVIISISGKYADDVLENWYYIRALRRRLHYV